MSDKIRLLDELHSIVARSRGVHAALNGCLELGGDEATIEGVTAVFLDNLDALTDFEDKLKVFLGKEA
jgi:hypothetical protein